MSEADVNSGNFRGGAVVRGTLVLHSTSSAVGLTPPTLGELQLGNISRSAEQIDVISEHPLSRNDVTDDVKSSSS